jgi:2-methylcitrate dehydratase PrpD
VDKFIQIVEENNLQPEAIDRVTAFMTRMCPWFDTLVTQEDLIMNMPYKIACAAHGIRPSHWHDPDVMKSPKILEFMRKIDHVEANESTEQDEDGAEVIANGKRFKETGYCKGGICTIRRISEAELIRKFDENNSGLLPSDKRDKLVRAILNLNELEDVAMIMQLATP